MAAKDSPANSKGSQKSSPKVKQEETQPRDLTLKIDKIYRPYVTKNVLDTIYKTLDVKAYIKGNRLIINEHDLAKTAATIIEHYILEACISLPDEFDEIDDTQKVIEKVIHQLEGLYKPNKGYEPQSSELCQTVKGKSLLARSLGQDNMAMTVRLHDLSIIYGAAGSGKTTVVAAIAADMLINNRIDKIVLTRPAIEAGSQKMGFLPGTKEEKIDPYIKPMRDVLEEVFGKPKYTQLCHEDKIESIPMSFIRGRSFNSSFIIADEMQNSTQEEMLTLLTRVGLFSKIVCLGDISQQDKNAKIQGSNGLEVIIRKFEKDIRVGIVEMGTLDIQRSWIVKAAIDSLS